MRQQPRQCINWVFWVETKKKPKYFLNNNSNRLLRYKFYPKKVYITTPFWMWPSLSLSLIFSYYRLFLVRISLIFVWYSRVHFLFGSSHTFKIGVIPQLPNQNQFDLKNELDKTLIMQPNYPLCTDYCPNKKRAKTIFLFWKLFLWIDLWSGWSTLTTWALVTIWIWLLLASTVISKFAFFTLFFFLFSWFCNISFAIVFFNRPEIK